MQPNVSQPLTVALLQLPVPEVQPLYNEGNIPLAAGYLKAVALASSPAGALDIRIIPRDIANFGGDSAVVDWVVETGTAMAGFTSYMWNIERNIRIARRLKLRNPDIFIIFGGPEIDGNHWVLDEPAIDLLVVGEGEQAFADILGRRAQGLPLPKILAAEHYLDLKRLPNPYLEKIIVPSAGESMFLETMRGCPYHCKYCFYSKSYSGMRYFSEDLMGSFFEMARQYNVPEVYVMDPSFNVAPGLKARLEKIARANSTKIPLHTEIRLESVTPKIAALMQQAGFHSAEVGLQSINPQALKAIHRSFDRDAFIAGARNLQEQGIDAKTGVILGLPHDKPRDFANTIDFLIDLNLQESMEIYPLSILPGTKLRDEAASFGLQHMDKPPYQVLSTPTMKQEEMQLAISIAEDKLGIEFFPPVIPRFHNNHQPFIHFLDLSQNPHQAFETLSQKPSVIGHSLTILWKNAIDHPILKRLALWIQEHNPSTLVQLILDRPNIPSKTEINSLLNTWQRPGAYFDRVHHAKIHPQKQHSIRFFHLTADLDTADAYLWQPQFCDLILRYTPECLTHGTEILEEKPILRIDTPIPNDQRIILNHFYAGFENFIIT
jgi:hypothetical protein